MSNIIIIGKNSIIYSDIKTRLKYKNIHEFSHNELIKIKSLKKKIDFIIYFGFDKKKYRSIDSQVINFASDRNIHLIYFSTRKVYKTSDISFHYNENSDLYAIDNYTKVKLFNESLINNRLKKFTILRLGNYIPSNIKLCINKKNFIGILLDNLKKNLIHFDFNPNVEKDFLFSDRFIKVLKKIINLNLIGTYNLSSGRAIRINEIIDPIKFNKHIEIIIKKTKKNESFILENHQINKKLMINYTDKNFRDEFDKFIKNLIKIINSIQ